jgi:hypothetical protein
MRRISIYLKLIILFLIFLLIAYLTQGNRNSDFIGVVLGISSFIFGVILAFSTANRHSRLSEIRQNLREQDALILNVYLLSKKFGKNFRDKIRGIFDKMLQAQIDYYLIDFDKTEFKEIEELYATVEKVKSKKGNFLIEKIIENIEKMVELQKNVAYHVKNKMEAYEWISLTLLAGVIIFCLFYQNNDTSFSILITALLSSLLILLLLILKDLDSLEWQEQNWIWEPLEHLFTELDLIPYFPQDVFKLNRVKIQKLKSKKIRVAYYPNKYPNNKGKKIEIIKI